MLSDSKEFTAHSFYRYLTEDKRLMGVRCRGCGELTIEPRPTCAKCHGREMEWYEYSGRGHLSSFTCISIVPAFMAKRGYGRTNPYCAGIVDLEEGPRVSALILGVDPKNPQNIKCGMAVVLELGDLDVERPSLAFRPA